MNAAHEDGAAAAQFTIGIDLGGTKIAALLFDLHAQAVRARIVVPTSREGPAAVIAQMGEAAAACTHAAGVSPDAVYAVGVGAPATIDYAAGETLFLPNLPGEWANVAVERVLGAHTGRPCLLLNDARAFTLAEAVLGAGRGAETAVCFTLGTGIGGGIAIGGRLHMGLMGAAGEFGHHSISWDGLPDGSGTPGGLESLCSGPAIAAMGVKAVLQGVNTTMRERCGNDLNRITPGLIAEAADDGDATAQAIFARAAGQLGAALANLAVILAPDVIVLGGGLAHQRRWLVEPAIAAFRARTHAFPFAAMRIETATLGDDAGAIGAALWAAAPSRGGARRSQPG